MSMFLCGVLRVHLQYGQGSFGNEFERGIFEDGLFLVTLVNLTLSLQPGENTTWYRGSDVGRINTLAS